MARIAHIKQLHMRAQFRIALTNQNAQVAEMVIAAGDSEGGPDNSHKESDQWLFVLEGKGVALVAGKRKQLKSGSLLLIERGMAHEIRNTGRSLLKTINFYVPPAYTKSGEPRPSGKPPARTTSKANAKNG